MRNFWRVLGQARRYPLTLLGIVATSLLVALFWGANIGTVYPLVEIAFEGETASGWLERKIEQSQARIRMWERQAETHPADARIRYHLRAERLLAERYVSARPWVAAYAPRTAWGLLAAIMGLLLVGTLLKNVVLAANLLLVERLAQTVTCDLRQAFFRHVLAMDLRTLDGRHSSDMIARLTSDMNSITGALAALLGRAVREPLKMIACLAGALWISWRLTLVSLIAAPLAACLIGVLARALKRASRRALEQMNEMYGVLSEVLASMEIVKAYTLEEDKARRFDRSARQFRRRMLRIAFYQALLRPSTELLGIGMISLAILAGGYLVLHQQTHLFGLLISPTPLDRGQLITFFALLIGASDPLRKLVDVFGAIQKGAAGADRIYQEWDRKPQVRPQGRTAVVPRPASPIVFRNVRFAYRPGRTVLCGLDLRIDQGERVALVGPNGCGKSTLLRLLLRFFDPDEGEVSVGGVRLADVDPHAWRQRLALVTQEPRLFDGTILENIWQGRLDAPRQTVLDAARRAQVDAFVHQLPRGYDTPIGERGSQLSGGQRQRIALARALLREPEVFLLDEATSQVDGASEEVIHRALDQVLDGRTAILVTHRPSALRLADRIVVMRDGRIEAIGQHAQLLRDSATYRQLFPTDRQVA